MKGIRSILIFAAAATLAIPITFRAHASPIGGGILTRANSGQIVTTQIADGAVTMAKIAAGAVTATQLGTGAVTSTKLADNAVTAPQLAGGAVTTAKLGTGAVTSTTIGAQAVTWAKLAMFRSTQQTGTGASANIAHGLGVTPQWCQIIAEDTTAAGIVAAGYACSYGTHTSTNCLVTCTTGLKYTVIAVAP